MMKRTLLTLCTAAALYGCTAFAQNNMTSKTIETGHLRGVAAHSGFDVTLKQGPTSSAVISVDSRLQPYLRATVSDGVLSLGFDNLPTAIQRQNLSRKAEVTVNTLEKLNVHSGAYVHGSGNFTADECDVEVHSGAQVKEINITAKEVEVSVHSGARAVLSGSTDKLEASTASGASADLTDLRAKEVQAGASSGSTIGCWATNSIKGRASSGATIRYKGNPAHTDNNSSSGGSVRPAK